jgi:hypothetical protein
MSNDLIDRISRLVGENERLTMAVSIAVEALRLYEDIIDGQYGPRANAAMEAIQQIQHLTQNVPVSMYDTADKAQRRKS